MKTQEPKKKAYSKIDGAKKTAVKTPLAIDNSRAHTGHKKPVAGAYHQPDEAIRLQLNEALHSFVASPAFAGFNSNTTASLGFSDFLANKLMVVQAIRNGIPYAFFNVIQNLTPFTLSDWADYLDISGKSLSRYQQQDKPFKSIHTEKIIELAEVSLLGLEVFGDHKKFRLWLETPNYALGLHKPFDLLRDSYGKEMIVGELTRIEYGILG